MRIGVFVESFPKITEAWLSNQIIDLIKRGVDVQIFSIYQKREGFVHPQVRDWKLIEKTHYFFYPKGPIAKRILSTFFHVIRNLPEFNWKGLILLVKNSRLNKLEPLFLYNYLFMPHFLEQDIIHSHFGEIGVIASKFKQQGLLPNTKLVTSFHGHDIFPYRKEYYQKAYQIFHDNVSSLIVNSPYSEELLNDIVGKSSRLSVIPVGLDSNYFRNQSENKETGEIRIIFIGRLVFLKGADLMIEIFSHIHAKFPNSRLVLIGGGELMENISKLIDMIGIRDSVELKGALNQDEIKNELSSGDVFVYPGKTDKIFGASDTQGLVVQEAQSFNLPVVCSDVGGIRFGMVDGETGFLVKENDLKGFVDKITYLIENPEIRKRMGQAGRDFVKKNFDSAVVGQKLMNVYQTVLNG